MPLLAYPLPHPSAHPPRRRPHLQTLGRRRAVADAQGRVLVVDEVALRVVQRVPVAVLGQPRGEAALAPTVQDCEGEEGKGEMMKGTKSGFRKEGRSGIRSEKLKEIRKESKSEINKKRQ